MQLFVQTVAVAQPGGSEHFVLGQPATPFAFPRSGRVMRLTVSRRNVSFLVFLRTR
ncbi:MAG TPA: hypothetical protein VMW75_06830 [Thermoanaerobaculia bacterium]|nr:hypothetical protein [Thermoanaerobaculia bacterium]